MDDVRQCLRSIKRRLEDPRSAKEARVKTDAEIALDAIERRENACERLEDVARRAKEMLDEWDKPASKFDETRWKRKMAYLHDAVESAHDALDGGGGDQ